MSEYTLVTRRTNFRQFEEIFVTLKLIKVNIELEKLTK